MSFVIIGLKKFHSISLKKGKNALFKPGKLRVFTNAVTKGRGTHLQGDLEEEPTAIKILPHSLCAHISLPWVLEALTTEDLVASADVRHPRCWCEAQSR